MNDDEKTCQNCRFFAPVDEAAQGEDPGFCDNPLNAEVSDAEMYKVLEDPAYKPKGRAPRVWPAETCDRFEPC